MFVRGWTREAGRSAERPFAGLGRVWRVGATFARDCACSAPVAPPTLPAWATCCARAAARSATRNSARTPTPRGQAAAMAPAAWSMTSGRSSEVGEQRRASETACALRSNGTLIVSSKRKESRALTSAVNRVRVHVAYTASHDVDAVSVELLGAVASPMTAGA
eukprot:scaffold20352_cov28-Tisochrysis_lutea.AAC.2